MVVFCSFMTREIRYIVLFRVSHMYQACCPTVVSDRVVWCPLVTHYILAGHRLQESVHWRSYSHWKPIVVIMPTLSSLVAPRCHRWRQRWHFSVFSDSAVVHPYKWNSTVSIIPICLFTGDRLSAWQPVVPWVMPQLVARNISEKLFFDIHFWFNYIFSWNMYHLVHASM